MERKQQSEDIYTQLVQDAGALSALAEDWDDLFKRSANATPYLSRSWVSTFIETKRLCGNPVIIAAWCGEKLVALLPLAVRRFLNIKIAEPIGTGLPAYLGLLLDLKYSIAINVIAETFVQKKVAQVLCINDLSSEDQVTDNLLDALVKNNFLYRRANRNLCHHIRLGSSYDEYLIKTKNAKRRKKLRYEERRLFASGNVAVNHYIGTKITPKVLDRVAKIQEKSWMKRRGAAVLGQPFYQKLLIEMAKTNFGNVWLMTINGQDAAFVYALIARRTLYYHRTAFNLRFESPLSVGKVLTMQVIRSACENNMLFFDFGHGDAKYKRFWANESHRVDRVVVGRDFGGRLIAICYFAVWRLAKIKSLRSLFRKAKGFILSITKGRSL